VSVLALGSAAGSQLAPLAIAGPILVACVLVGVGGRLPRWVVDATATATAVAAVAMDGSLLVTASTSGRLVTWLGGWSPADGYRVGIALVIDPVAAGAACVAAILTVCAFMFSWRYLDGADARFHALMLLFLAGMTGFVLSGDLFDMFVFFELMGVVAYALTGFRIEDPSAVQGALVFGVVNSLGAYLSLCGIALVYARAGELGLAQLGEALRPGGHDALLVGAFTLIVTGFLVKAAVVPFHFWLDDAHAVAPTPVCVLLSGIMVELGLYGTFRVYTLVFAAVLDPLVVHRAFLVLGTVTALVGAVMCVGQRHLKRLLAYSTIAHVGTFLLALATLDPIGMGGALLSVLGHAGVKGALFLIAGVILNSYGSVDEIELYGRGHRARVLPWLMVVAGLALAGLPPFGVALGKSLADEALADGGARWAVVVSVLVAALTGAAVLRSALRIFRGAGSRPPETANREVTTGDEHAEVGGLLPRVPLTMLAPIGILLLSGLAVGLIPASSAVGAAYRFLDREDAVGQVLAGRPPAVVPPSGAGWTASGVLLGFGSVLLAVLLTLAMLHGDRIGRRFERSGLAHPARATLAGLRALHSGHIGDYVSWQFAGIALLGVLFTIPH
jgi:multicomponent Na+:H+ antiporter subunit D